MVWHHFVNITGVFHPMEHLIPFGDETWESRAQNDPVNEIAQLLYKSKEGYFQVNVITVTQWGNIIFQASSAMKTLLQWCKEISMRRAHQRIVRTPNHDVSNELFNWKGLYRRWQPPSWLSNYDGKLWSVDHHQRCPQNGRMKSYKCKLCCN